MKNQYEKKYPQLGEDGLWRDRGRKIFDPDLMRSDSKGEPEVTHGGYFRYKDHDHPILEESAIEDVEIIENESQESGKNKLAWAMAGLGTVILFVASFGRIKK